MFEIAVVDKYRQSQMFSMHSRPVLEEPSLKMERAEHRAFPLAVALPKAPP